MFSFTKNKMNNASAAAYNSDANFSCKDNSLNFAFAMHTVFAVCIFLFAVIVSTVLNLNVLILVVLNVLCLILSIISVVIIINNRISPQGKLLYAEN